jgi:hypothetical protein
MIGGPDYSKYLKDGGISEVALSNNSTPSASTIKAGPSQ